MIYTEQRPADWIAFLDGDRTRWESGDSEAQAVDALRKSHGLSAEHPILRILVNYWGEITGYPVADWKRAVEENETRLGYRDWVASLQEAEAEAEAVAASDADDEVFGDPGRSHDDYPSPDLPKAQY